MSRAVLSLLFVGLVLFGTLTSPTAAQQAPSSAQAGPGQPVAPPADPWPGKKKLLIIADVQTGFHHDSINHAIAVIEKLGRDNGGWVSVIRTDSQLLTKQPIMGQGTRYASRPINAHNLNFFDAIFYLGSGAGALTDQQKQDLLSFVKTDGKGFIAGHAASVAYYEWPEYIDMIGGFMESEYRPASMQLMIDDPKFPGASAFNKSFAFNDQFPVMRAPFSSKDVHVIARLDPRKMTAEDLKRRPDGDIPVVWAKNYGAGRVYNLTIGHREEVWDDPRFQKMAASGIRWALGMVDADVTPGVTTAPALTK